ncbi:MAG: threonine/serine exporter family protein [Bacillales bacterium]|nr:threonine/serine exporter family protein [Bacillales bacterium]
MENVEYIVNFATRLGREMLSCGANLERVNLTIESICKHYGITDIGLHSLSVMISLSITDQYGNSASKIVKVPSLSLNMEKLKELSALAKKVAHETPNVKCLDSLLDETLNKVKIHPNYVIYLGYLIAMMALARLFGGSWQDIIVALLNTALLVGLKLLFSKITLNRVITNFFSMFSVGVIAGLLCKVGFVQNFYVVVLTNAFFLIPGIPMINSVRSMICGNEMNGLVELFKVIIESLTIVAGVAASYFLFENHISLTLENAFPPQNLTNIWVSLELMLLSFLASFGFGLTFNINWKEIFYASFGAVLVRLVYILLLIGIPQYSFVVVLVSAFSADLFSEILVLFKKRPATYYLYTFVIPLIPGDLVAYSMFGIVWNNGILFSQNIVECLTSLLGISVGFVLASAVMHYVRKIKIVKEFNKKIK